VDSVVIDNGCGLHVIVMMIGLMIPILMDGMILIGINRQQHLNGDK
jgi:hypothetical protein